MTFRQYLLILWARRQVVLRTFFATVGVTLLISLVLTRQYTASTAVVVDVKSPDPIAGVVLPRQRVIDAMLDVVTWEEALARIQRWSDLGDSRYVCICNAHSVVTASLDSTFRTVINGADMATPDGAPVAWMIRRLGFRSQQRINGPDLMWKYCALASQRDESIFLYGGTPATLDRLTERLYSAFPGLKIAGAISPPFRPLSEDEMARDVAAMNASGARTVWVSLGCPKQEQWMAVHRGRIDAVMIGVGAAFDYHAGILQRAPLWMQRSGLEWLHRLCSEPRRLWKRYLVTNTLFILGATRQLLSSSNKE